MIIRTFDKEDTALHKKYDNLRKKYDKGIGAGCSSIPPGWLPYSVSIGWGNLQPWADALWLRSHRFEWGSFFAVNI